LRSSAARREPPGPAKPASGGRSSLPKRRTPAFSRSCRIGRREVAISNPNKVFFPEPELSKGDLVQYYVDIAGCVLNHVRRRPMQIKKR